MSELAGSAATIGKLAEIVGTDNVLVGERAGPYATDVYRPGEAPAAVVRPGSVGELQAVVQATAAARAGLMVRGGGASYTDGYIPRRPGLVLVDLGRLNRIVEINELDGYVTVEAGVTWAALKVALDARGLRTPFWGPFSGLAATVGGSVSQNSISHGSGAYGISAQSVLCLEVVTADGALLKTGSAAAGAAPFARHFGPDLTGLFTGDCGAFGIKARITLPLLAARPAHRTLSFSFPTFEAMHEAMRRVAMERLEDSHFALDAALSQGQIARQDRAGATLSMAMGILRSSPSIWAGVGQLAKAALSARRELGRAAFMVHYIVEGVDDHEARSRVHRIRGLVAFLGREISATVPAVVRDMPFAPLFNTLGPNGERWVPLHGILAHSKAAAFHAALEAFYAARRQEMSDLGVWTGGMFATVGSSGFLYEIALYWPDAITDYHRANVPADYLKGLPSYPDNPQARAYVDRLKTDLVSLLAEHGAVNFQLGKAYPFRTRLAQEPGALLDAIKTNLDPAGRMSPGNLGL